MSTLYAQVSIRRSASDTYSYLRHRYESDVYRSASMMSKGYVPKIECIDARPDEHISFRVAGRDAVFKTKAPGWQWQYDLKPSGDTTTVSITYTWGILLSLASSFTARHQAANELVETAMALDALQQQA